MGAIITRGATPADARDAVEVVRRSIAELCAADHQHDGPTLERWLRNKTPEHFASWCADADNRTIIAELSGVIAGVALLHCSGEVRLFYVKPECVRSGVGQALLHALEAQARDCQIACLKLESSLTARPFYERHGFVSTADSRPHFGVLRGYPYTKAI
ncbi:MAG TPA: GNAT family N-acetyltransferase [Polyangiaceae bacterium]|jgi:putative acetyltransferase|nr:GNAT family N-acetyltransferase [Polyangiaceae bacterium]